MTNNIGSIERFFRIALGVALLSCVFLFSGNLRWAGLVGLLPLVTGLIGWCPFYTWLSWLTLD
jgi:hypothetical protein